MHSVKIPQNASEDDFCVLFSHVVLSTVRTYVAQPNVYIYISELGTSLFEIAQSLFTLEQTLISGAKEQFKKKSEERRAN